jgi:hypothetical protein
MNILHQKSAQYSYFDTYRCPLVVGSLHILLENLGQL